MIEPTTEAGRRLLTWWRTTDDAEAVLADILAIEAEARAECDAVLANYIDAVSNCVGRRERLAALPRWRVRNCGMELYEFGGYLNRDAVLAAEETP